MTDNQTELKQVYSKLTSVALYGQYMCFMYMCSSAVNSMKCISNTIMFMGLIPKHSYYWMFALDVTLDENDVFHGRP